MKRLKALILTTALLVAAPAFAQSLPPTKIFNGVNCHQGECWPVSISATQTPSFDGTYRMYLPWSAAKRSHCAIDIADSHVFGDCSTVYAGHTCLQSVDGSIQNPQYIHIWQYYYAYGDPIDLTLTPTNGYCAGIPSSFTGAITAQQPYPQTPRSYGLGPNPQGTVTRR